MSTIASRLFTVAQYEQLISNGSPQNRDQDHVPVAKLFLPGTGCTWLLTEIDPEEPDLAFGLCDLGMGFPELGYVSLEEITSVKTRYGMSVERDLHFTGKHSISVYARAARSHSQIVEQGSQLEPHIIKKTPGPQPE